MKSFKIFLKEALVYGYHGRPTEFLPGVDPQTYFKFKDKHRHHYGTGIYHMLGTPNTEFNPEIGQVALKYAERGLGNASHGKIEQGRPYDPQVFKTKMDTDNIIHSNSTASKGEWKRSVDEIIGARFSGDESLKDDLVRTFATDMPQTNGHGYETYLKRYSRILPPYVRDNGSGMDPKWKVGDAPLNNSADQVKKVKTLRSIRNQMYRRLAAGGFQGFSPGTFIHNDVTNPTAQVVTPGQLSRNIKPTVARGPNTGTEIRLMSTRPSTKAEEMAKQMGAKLMDPLRGYTSIGDMTPEDPAFLDDWNRTMRSTERQIKYVEKPATALKSVAGKVLKGLGVAGAIANPAETAAQAVADAAGGRLAGALGAGAGAALFINQSAGDPVGDAWASWSPEMQKAYTENEVAKRKAQEEERKRQQQTDRDNYIIRNPPMGGPRFQPKY